MLRAMSHVGQVSSATSGQVGGSCTRFPGFTGRCSADRATHLKKKRSKRRELHTRELGPKPSAWLLGYAPKKWEQDPESHRKEPAYETGGGLSASCCEKWWERLGSHQHRLGFNESCRLPTPRSRKAGRSRGARTLPAGFGDQPVRSNFWDLKGCRPSRAAEWWAPVEPHHASRGGRFNDNRVTAGRPERLPYQDGGDGGSRTHMSLLAGQVPCWSATSPKKEREKRWTRGPELHRRGTVLRTAGWLLSHRANENKPQLRSLGGGRLFRPPSSMTGG